MNDDDRPGARARLLALAVIVSVGALLRFAWLGRQSYWYDETVSAELAREPLAAILRGADGARDLGNPPLYFALLRLHALVFGDGDATLRALSAAIGVASLPLAYDVGRRTLGARAGLVAAALLAIAPAHVYFAQEARTYALSTLLALASADALLVALERPRSAARWACFSAATFLSVYAHYFGAFVALALCVAALSDRARRAAVLRPLAIAVGVAAAVWLAAWAPAFLAQVGTKGNLTRSADTWFSHVLATPLVFAVGTTLLWKDTASVWRAVAAALALTAFAVPAVRGAIALRDRPAAARLLVPWLLVPTLGPALVSALVSPLYAVRYVLLASPAFLLVVAAGLVALGPAARRAAGGGIALSAALSLSLYFTGTVKHAWRTVARFVDERARPGDVAVFDADIGEEPFARYARAEIARLRLVPPVEGAAPDAFFGTPSRGGALDDVTATLVEAPRVFAVLSDPKSGSGDHYRRLLDRAWRTLEVRRFRGVEVRVCEPRTRARVGPRASRGPTSP